MRILIADDNELIRRGLIRILEGQDGVHICGEAADGAQAIELARQLAPDLILLDISMPIKDGLETARLLRQEQPQLKIIIMSHHDPAQVSTQQRNSTAHAWVDKGRLAVDLLAAINSLRAS
jgi:two-component system, NarL family, nitrate/nitrite response regulator NarL